VATFDYDVVIIGSGFGGSVAARAAEKGSAYIDAVFPVHDCSARS
jgi:flavin-dependent dehydrogenase